MNHHMSGYLGGGHPGGGHHRTHTLGHISAALPRSQGQAVPPVSQIAQILEDEQALAQWQTSLAELRRKDPK